MAMFQKISTQPLWVVPIAVVILIRVLLLNVNSAEWGDSYRILRASNYVRYLSYPEDEKRPPLFSALLAIRPGNVDAVLWGRIFMLGVSFLELFVFYLLCKKYLPTQNRRLLALLFLFLNPVYLYWSIRIYADVPFSLLVLLCFYVFEVWREKVANGQKPSAILLILMGLICGLGILTRFEGYLLAASTGMGIFFVGQKQTGSKIKALLKFVLATGIIILPWLIYRNPLTSSYFEEPAGRKYDLSMFLTYLTSYLLVLGVLPAFAVIANLVKDNWKQKILTSFKKYPHIIIFVVLESLLILAWPAAVPRLFVPVIPFLVILLVKSLDGFERQTKGCAIICSTVLIALYIVVQNKIRLQFLGPHTLVFITVIILGVLGSLAMVTKNRALFITSALISMLALSASTIYLHKDVYKSIVDVARFPLREPAGKIIHNDTAGIISWYHPTSEYKNYDTKKYLTQEYLDQNQFQYVIITNEFDPNLEIDLKKRPYLELIKESNYARGGKMFFTWLVKVKNETINSNTLL